MPVGSSVTYTVSCATGAASPGTLSNTATITTSVIDPNLADNSATDDTLVTFEADLEVTKTDGLTSRNTRHLADLHYHRNQQRTS